MVCLAGWMNDPVDSNPCLKYGTAVEVLRVSLGFEAIAESGIRARVRQLQKLGLFHKNQPYMRFDYGLVELAKLAAAFRLMDAFMPPMFTVRHLSERWTDLAPAMLAGIGDDLITELRAVVPAGDGPLVFVEGIALSQLGQKSKRERPYGAPLGRIETFRANAFEEVEGRAGLVIDTRSFMPALVQILREQANLTDIRIAHEINRLASS